MAARQGGVFTAAQARAEGWSGRQVARRIATGTWVRVAGKGLAQPCESGWTPFQLAVAASLTYPSAVVSHRSAGLLHGFRGLERLDDDGRVHVIAPAGRRSTATITTHQVPPGDDVSSLPVQVGGVPVRLTSPPRTAIDLLASAPPSRSLDLWAWVSTRGVLEPAALHAAIEARAGRPGTSNLRALATVVGAGAASLAEFRFHQLLRRARISGWTAGVPVHDGRGLIGVVDVLFAHRRLVVEIDGADAHATVEALQRDLTRQNRLVAAGYTVLRFTWLDLTRRPEQVLAFLRDALAEAV